MGFSTYQNLRKHYIQNTTFAELKIKLNQCLEQNKITPEQYTGLIREWRALNYLKKRMKQYEWYISDAENDILGIDIIGIKDDIKSVILEVQVGGNMIQDKRRAVDYYVQVTDDKIYLWKGGRNE